MGKIGYKRKQSATKTGNRGHTVAVLNLEKQSKEGRLETPINNKEKSSAASVNTGTSTEESHGFSSSNKRKTSPDKILQDRTSITANAANRIIPDSRTCFNATKRQRISCGNRLSEVAVEALEEEEMTIPVLGMKVASALKLALTTEAERKIIMDVIATEFGLSNPNIVGAGEINQNTPKKQQIARVAFVSPTIPIENEVIFDDDCFFKDLEDGETAVQPSTAWSRKWRAKMDVNAALNRHGTLCHQAKVIHEICTVGSKAGIGVALGILENPKQHASVVENLFQDTFEVLHCDRVIGRNNTQAIEFTHNTFLATAPTAPADNAPAEEKKAY